MAAGIVLDFELCLNTEEWYWERLGEGFKIIGSSK